MRQLLGTKKHKLCESIAGKKYTACWTTRTHAVAECWYDSSNADYVNYIVGHCWPTIREGQRVKEEK